MNVRNFIAAIALVMITASGLPGMSPLETVKSSNIGVLEIYGRHKTVTKETVEELFEVIEEVSDFPYTAAQIAAPYLSRLTSSEGKKFRSVLEKYLILVLKVRLKRRAVIHFDYLGEEINGDQAVVKTGTHYKKRKVQVDYLLRKEQNEWKIFNYRVEDTDSILSYQKQFTKLFSRYPFSTILSKLRIKMTKLQLRLEDESG